jgi:hypothetical protein
MAVWRNRDLCHECACGMVTNRAADTSRRTFRSTPWDAFALEAGRPASIPERDLTMMFKSLLAVAALSLASLHAAAGEPIIHVSVGGEISPGVYGRVDFGNAPPPPVLYPQPVVIVRQPQPVVVQPVYLHVPPGHAKRWSKYCHRYDACARPVYFVKSAEYEPRREHAHGKGHGKGRGHDD